jgi:hypothetical protein
MNAPHEPLDPEHCTECGGSIPPEAEVCPACGARLFDQGPEDTRSEHFRQGEEQPRWNPIEALDGQGKLHLQRVPDFEGLVPIFRGSMAEAVALRATLGARGFETYVRDESTKVIDPLITGGYVFDVTLDAPVSDAEAIQRLLAEERADWPEQELTPEEKLHKQLERLARNIILTALLFPPIGVVLVVRYAWLSRSCRGKQPGLGRVIVFGFICLAATLCMPVLFWNTLAAVAHR